MIYWSHDKLIAMFISDLFLTSDPEGWRTSRPCNQLERGEKEKKSHFTRICQHSLHQTTMSFYLWKLNKRSHSSFISFSIIIVENRFFMLHYDPSSSLYAILFLTFVLAFNEISYQPRLLILISNRFELITF